MKAEFFELESADGELDSPVEELVAKILDCTWVLFEQSSHLPHAEETGHYLKVLDDFLSRIEIGNSK